MDIGPSGQHMAQSSAWLKQSSNGRREFSTLTCGPNFDNVRHDRLLEKVARRVDDADIMHLLKMMLKASGKGRSSGRCDLALAQ